MIDNLHRLMNMYGCSTLVVHHTGVNPEAQNRARGSSAWRGAVDIEAKISCTKTSTGEKPVYLEQTNNKDAEMIDKLAFELKTVILPDRLDSFAFQNPQPLGVGSASICRCRATLSCRAVGAMPQIES